MYGHECCCLFIKKISMSFTKQRQTLGFAALFVHLRELSLVTGGICLLVSECMCNNNVRQFNKVFLLQLEQSEPHCDNYK